MKTFQYDPTRCLHCCMSDFVNQWLEQQPAEVDGNSLIHCAAEVIADIVRSIVVAHGADPMTLLKEATSAMAIYASMKLGGTVDTPSPEQSRH